MRAAVEIPASPVVEFIGLRSDKVSKMGVFYILVSAFGFALMALFVRLCDDYGPGISTFQKAFFRNFIALAVAASVMARNGFSVKSGCDRRSFGLLVLRSLFGSIGIFCNFYAISHISIADAMTLNKTSPFFAVLAAWIFLKERANLRQALCLAGAFAGALLVIKPGMREAGSFAAFCGLIGGLGAGLAYACVRALGRRGVDGALIVLFFSAFSCIASIPFVAYGGYTPMTWRQLAILVAAGIGAAIGQFGITAAYRHSAPRDIAPYDYFNIIFTALFGFFFFSQTPDALSIAGFAIIVAAAICETRASGAAGAQAPGRANMV